MAKVSEINGINKYAIKSVKDVRLNTVAEIAGGEILERAMCWTIKYAQGSSDNWLVTHTASGFDPANPTNDTEANYAPTGSWDAWWQGGYGDGGMSAQCFGPDNNGIHWWGSVRYNDVGRCFMHGTSSQIVDGDLDPVETHGVWPNDATVSNSRWQAYVTYGALDKVWILGKGQKNIQSLSVSYKNPAQSNDTMTWEVIPAAGGNLQGTSNTNKCQPVYCGGRKYAAIQGNNFYINTGTLSSSLTDDNHWITRGQPGISTDTQNWMAYGGHPDHPDGVFVVLGPGNDEIKISTDDGGNWDDANVGAGGTARTMYSVCYNSRKRQFIAVGAHGRILTSSATEVTSWGPIPQTDADGDLGNTHYGVRTDGYNTVVTVLNIIRISTGSLEVFEDVPTATGQTAGKTCASTADSYFMWGACPGIVPIQQCINIIRHFKKQYTIYN